MVSSLTINAGNILRVTGVRIMIISTTGVDERGLTEVSLPLQDTAE